MTKSKDVIWTREEKGALAAEAVIGGTLIAFAGAVAASQGDVSPLTAAFAGPAAGTAWYGFFRNAHRIPFIRNFV